MKERYQLVVAVAHAETEKAFCCSFSYDDVVFSQEWVPKSQILEEYHEEIEDVVRGEAIEIAISDWWLDQKI